MSEWVKAIGVDFGKARIGVSISDEIGFLAHPLETIPAGDANRAGERIREIVEEKQIHDVVIGLPLHVDGREGDAVDGVRRFEEILKKKLPVSVQLHEVDERFTTQMAMEKLHEAGRTAKNSKGIIDQAAAVEILQQWLDRRAEESPERG